LKVFDGFLFNIAMIARNKIKRPPKTTRSKEAFEIVSTESGSKKNKKFFITQNYYKLAKFANSFRFSLMICVRRIATARLATKNRTFEHKIAVGSFLLLSAFVAGKHLPRIFV